jgi:hypothetical protein
MLDSSDIFGGVAVTGTNTYKSLVSRQIKRHFYQPSTTSDAAGTLSREVNNLSDMAYGAALAVVAAAHPSYTAAQVEAANTTGWVAQSFLQSDVTNAGATIAMAAAASFTANMPPGPRRSRLSYVNSSGGGALSCPLQLS